MGFGVECGLGWYEIISSVCWMISQHERNKEDNKKYLEKNDPERLASLPEYFPVKFDQVKEPLGKGRFANLEEAIQLFASRKNLNVNQFKSMFNVEKE